MLRHDLHSLVHVLSTASYFEDAATAALQAMFACAEHALHAGPYAGRVRILRGVVHLRSSDSYQRLFALAHPSGARIEGEGVGYLASATVWRWIQSHRCSVSLDLQRASLQAWLADGPIEQGDAGDGTGVPGDATRERLLDRDTTHVHVVPLLGPGGAVDGMITLEATCAVVADTGLVWADCHAELETLAGIAGAVIAARALPARRPPVAAPDELLPVVGARTGAVLELLRAFAPRGDTLLITGPSGAGKSRMARWCHAHSARQDERFEVLDLLSVPDELQMAELFGWRRGAFTGALRDNPGAIARAARGTLFLDEIDKLSLKAQAGLLRFIEERLYRALGDDADERRADVRLLVGTNADLHALVRQGQFREDLYYRINVLPIRIPPLEDRIDELAGWSLFMLRRCHAEADHPGEVRLDTQAQALIAATRWPGNLRQLDNILRRAYALMLAAHDAASCELIVHRHHIMRALAFDGHDAEPSSLLRQLWRTAHQFVQEVGRRRDGATPLELDLCDAFRGMVLGAALQQSGSRDAAFVLVGQAPLLKNRNHHRALRRELARVRALHAVVGGEIDPDLQAVLDYDEVHGAT